ncbi:Ig-like domain-containing protein, partial [Arsenicibacter rosenii]|uniref:Ig-like domain-containing protein n=1 Tax=Arsenicibacter rosenii TaxID=1750698 RepID=UPI00116062E7
MNRLLLFLMFLLLHYHVHGQNSGSGPITLSVPESVSSIQWYKDGSAVSGAISTTYLASTTGTYYATYTDATSACTGLQTNFFILINSGTTVTLDGQTNNSGGTGYQWLSNGAAISGATSTTYATSTGGVYSLTYSNGSCAVNTLPYQVFVLTTTVPCSATVAPALSATTKQNICPATTIDLSTITASNSPGGTTLSWHSATPATAANKLSSVTALVAGTYYAAFQGTNSGTACYGPTTAVNATSTTCNGGGGAGGCLTDVKLTIAESVTGAQWYKDGTALSGSTSTSISANSPGLYYATYSSTTGTCNAQQTYFFLLIQQGEYVTLNGQTNNSGGTDYQWLKNGVAISGATSTTYNVIEEGVYSLTFNGGSCGLTSIPYNVMVLNPCCSATVAPALSANSKNNVCPATTVDLSTITASNAPVSSTLSWHSATPATAANKLASISAVAGGAYYAAFEGTKSGSACYGPTTAFSAISTTCTVVCSATTVPTLSTATVSNSCPDKTISLAGITGISLPANTTLTWHSSATATFANQLTTLTGLPAGTYYAALNGGLNCYGPTVAVVASVTNCDTVLPPVPPSTTACDYATAPANVTFTVSNAPVGYSVNYLLVDRVTGAIVQSSTATASFSAVGQGAYLITAAWYKGTLVNAVPGKLISTVYESETGCLKYSDYLQVRVCSDVCDYASAPANLTFTTSPSPTTGVTTTYVLVNDVTNLIVATSQTPTFSGVTQGDYAIAAVYYTGSLTLTPGTSLFAVTTNNDNCQAVSNAIRVRICSCPANVAPVLSAITKQNTCPALTADLSTITASNTPLSTTLTWHSATPASMATEISSVSSVTAGTYYAAFKGVNSGSACYGPTTAVVVTLTICPQAPIARNDINNTNVNTPVLGNVLTNDTDPQGLPLSVSITPGCVPSSGTVVMSTNGDYTYTPATGFVGSVSFCYQVCNSNNQCATAVVNINVNPGPIVAYNNPPIANNDNTQTRQGVPVTINVTANDTDPDSATSGRGQLGSPALIAPLLSASIGSATIVNGQVVFTPAASFTGIASFPYRICDQGTDPGPLCATAVVTVNVLPAPPVGTTLAPVAIDDALLTQVNTPKGGSLATNDSDPNNPPLALTYTAGSYTTAHGTIVVAANGSYTYTPATGYVGPDSYSYTVCNTANKCTGATLNILVQQPIYQSPVAKND